MAHAPLTLFPNTVSPLMLHRIIGKTLLITSGTATIQIGERLHTLRAGQSVTIPPATAFSMANLSPSYARIEETHNPVTFAHDVSVIADAAGQIFFPVLSPALQAIYSVYDGLCDMRIADIALPKAA
ncbi:MAG: cupin domain-containing protein [Pseudobdellovibrionaceae bacterium]